MAKVKDQIRDRSEVSYIDAAGRTCYLDELFRHIMSDAYPLPSLNPTGVARRSSRGHNGPTQGNGSPEQLPYRMCFQECTDRWNALPDECPSLPACEQSSSKKKVWDARQAQGVMCSYFDLYMSCCMKSCTKITITGPGGASFSGGSIGSTEGCWPCEPIDETGTLSIEYTTQQMRVNESQALTARDSAVNGALRCCNEHDIIWTVSSGGGSLSQSFGRSVTYTAPSANGDCLQNPTITLTDCFDRTASLQLAVNAVFSQDMAFQDGHDCLLGECIHDTNTGFPTCGNGTLCMLQACYFTRSQYLCDGTEYEQLLFQGQSGWDPCHTDGYCYSILGANACDGDWHDADWWCAHKIDCRTVAQMAEGCCPEQLL